MKKPIELKQRTTNEYFGKVFSRLYKEWKSRTPDGNQQMFAELCFLSSNRSISKYVNGKTIPTDATIDEIIRVFNEAGMNVTIEDFIPHTGEDMMLYDPRLLNKMQSLNWEFAKEIGLSEGFLDFLFNYTGFNDPDEGYPTWSFLQEHLVRSFTTQDKELKYLEGYDVLEYYHFPMLQTCAVSDNSEFTVNDKNGKSTITQTIDLRILKDLQDEIVAYIQYFYYKRKKELKAQEIEATKLTNPIDQIDPKEKKINYHAISRDELLRIDPYTKYLDWK